MVKHAENEKNLDINKWKYQFGTVFWTISHSKKNPSIIFRKSLNLKYIVFLQIQIIIHVQLT